MLLAAFLSGCGGGGDATAPGLADNTPTVHTSTVLVPGFPGAIPRYVYDVPSNTLNNPPGDLYGWSLVARHMGAHPYDSGNFDARDNRYRSRIDTADFEVTSIRGAGEHTALEWRFNDEPMFRNGQPLVVSFNAALGEQQTTDNVAQASLITYVTDGDQNVFVLVFNFFDSRYPWFAPYVSNDTYTAFVSSPFSSGPYATAMQGKYSHNMTITENNMRSMINDLNAKCTVHCIKWHSDLVRYKFLSTGILHEVFVTNSAQRLVSELEVNGFEIAR